MTFGCNSLTDHDREGVGCHLKEIKASHLVVILDSKHKGYKMQKKFSYAFSQAPSSPRACHMHNLQGLLKNFKHTYTRTHCHAFGSKVVRKWNTCQLTTQMKVFTKFVSNKTNKNCNSNFVKSFLAFFKTKMSAQHWVGHCKEAGFEITKQQF